MDVVVWIGFGDGIILGGIEVVLWKRKIKFWEIAWKFRMNIFKVLFLIIWFFEGFLVVGVYFIKCFVEGLILVISNVSYCISVF